MRLAELLHPPPGHGDPGHGGDPAGRDRRVAHSCHRPPCPASTSPPSRSPPACPAPAPRRWPPRWRRRWSAVRDHRRHRHDDLHQRPRGRPRSPSSSPWTATSTRAALDVQSAIASRARRLPHGHADPAFLPEGQPGGPADPVPGPVARRRCRCRGERLCRKPAGPAASRMIERRGPGAICGGQKFAVRVAGRPRPRPPAASASTTCAAPLGRQLEPADRHPRRRHAARSPSRPAAADERRRLPPAVVAWRNGRPGAPGPYRRSAATGSRTTRRPAGTTTSARHRAGVQRQPDANTVEVVDRIREALPPSRRSSRRRSRSHILNDRSVSIREAVYDVKFTLMLTVALVVLVIFLFLQHLSRDDHPGARLPVSLIGTFAAMYAAGLLDRTTSRCWRSPSAVGFVVDDAIVMLENIVRHIGEGQGAVRRRRWTGPREIGFTIVSMTLSLVAVFIPVLFMGGVVGRLFREFAVTISVAILISGFVSLTLTPMLCSPLPQAARAPCAARQPVRPRGRLRGGRHGHALPGEPGLRAAPPVRHPGGDLRHPGLRHPSLHGRAQGLLPHRGHRLPVGDHRGAAGHRLRRDGGAAAQGGGDHPGRSRGRLFQLAGRGDQLNSGPHVRGAEEPAEGRTE